VLQKRWPGCNTGLNELNGQTVHIIQRKFSGEADLPAMAALARAYPTDHLQITHTHELYAMLNHPLGGVERQRDKASIKFILAQLDIARLEQQSLGSMMRMSDSSLYTWRTSVTLRTPANASSCRAITNNSDDSRLR
jgi:hypothetical protein